MSEAGAATPPAAARPAVTLLKGCVHAYRYTLRGVIGSHCRHYPSCSDYALEALTVHGAARGTLLSARRILRCNPWHPGGFDPVPPAGISFSRAASPDQVSPPDRDLL